MRNPPALIDYPRYPAVASTVVLAVGITFAWWLKEDISMLFATAEIRRGELWRLVTCIFPHLSVLHLIFNVYWLLAFGSIIEEIYGHTKTALLIVFLAFGSNAFEFAFARGGAGLSGVGYGLFGLLWVLSRRDDRFRDAMDQRTVTLFVGWFFFCIVTTLANIMPVGNVAHGAGALLGMLTGIAITMPRYRLLTVSGTAALVLFGLWGATFGRPMVNLSGKAGYEEGKWGYDALIANRNQEAARWLRDATKMQPTVPSYWFDLGIAYQRLGNMPAAKAAYQRAHQLKPDDPKYSLPDEN
jgi:membrane associated rhomboid family serine protease